jgi:two-component system alkaline phosphatase synthesis response regulator PhoP
MPTPTNKTVLIVEDEVVLLQALVDAFGAEGFTALGAANGEEGLAVAREKHPDIILLDIIMPKMDGMTMLKQLQGDAWGKQVPVIILTNLSDYRTVADALSKGVHDFLVKSDWEIEDVIKAVRQKLGIK